MKEYSSDQKKTVSRASANHPVLQKKSEPTAQLKARPVQKKENNTGLPSNLKVGVENLSGYSMNDVKVHRNSNKPAQMKAHAYAQGSDIHLGPGQEKHLPHEVWHVVQQKQGRVQPTAVQKKTNINDDASLEKEADVMGTKALQTSNQNGSLQRNVVSKASLQKKKSANGVMQLYKQYANSGEANSKKIIHWKSNGKPLRVAEDGTAAVAQARASGGKEMYVAASRLPKINSDLKKVNAPVEFAKKGGGTVEGAPPGNLDTAKKTLVQVKPVEPGNSAKEKEIPDDCGNAARTVTGTFAEKKALKGKYNDAGGKVKNTANTHPEMMKYEVMVEHFGAKIKDSAKVLAEIGTLIKPKKGLSDILKPVDKRVQLIQKAINKNGVDLSNKLASTKADIDAYIALGTAIPSADPKRAEKIAAIRLSIKGLTDAYNLYLAAAKKKEADLLKKYNDILAETIGGKTVKDIYKEYVDIVAKHKKLSDSLMKPYNDQSAGDKDKFDKKAGINRYSNPDIGGAYTMSSGGAPYPSKKTWNYHWAGVIFKSTSSSDNITMENYAGNAKSEWRLQMYGVPTKGNARAGQTFHDAHKATEQHGKNPTTLTTEKK